MPELAEIETLKNYLGNHIVGEEIQLFISRRNNLRYIIDIKSIENHANSTKIIEVRRVAKFLVIELDSSYSLVFHLGMSGKLTKQGPDYKEIKHDHIIVDFKSKNKLVFNDARRFGMVYICKTAEMRQQKFLQNMGQEPLEDAFNAGYLSKQLSSRKAPIKNTIMDSKIVVGVGNIYAAESLFDAGIDPSRDSSTLNSEDIERLVGSIKKILKRAIKAGGTTLKDFVNGDNTPGYFQQELNVYDRFGQPCHICSNLIEKIKQAGRSTYFCPNCQK
ncbi:MAG: bifunctional DNA-formamidopyrimidine glycosylase/DNA-(apurinic or apyrimidinic site) lyase [Rickettsiaceae bacterium]|nr:bifunctional DNA-formamidopyrimidine glycosylase/DNA-(apurinic or apyrimidinic site) lyase [Rickettsiaceae bacterium]